MSKWLCVAAAAGLLAGAGCASMDSGAAGADTGDLRAMVLQRLAIDPVTRADVFGVEVQGDRVTLRGTVRNETGRLRALGLVRGTPGVASVDDRLRVIP